MQAKAVLFGRATMLLLTPLVICCAAIPLAWAAGRRRAAWAGAVVFAAAVASTGALLALRAAAPPPWVQPWIPEWGLFLTFQLDGLAATYAIVAAGIAILVVAYAGGYMPHHLHEQHRHERELVPFFVLIALFIGAMIGLATSGTLLQLFVFWEITTICSYLLIAYDRPERDARRAALLAVIVTGGAAVLLLIGALLLLARYGSTRFDALLAGATPDGLTMSATILILIAALAKSAQWPLHFWLPRAMVAPTPVSAYLHAAAMVAAGVFLLQRIEPLLHLDAPLATSVLALGWISMIAGGFAALREDEMKRVLAYSTIAQYGHIVFLVGLGGAHAAGAAAFFVVAHAICKSALFLSAGAVTAATGEKQLSSLGGLRRTQPLLAMSTAVVAAGLAGAPLTIGFFKDELLFAAAHEHGLWMLGVAVSGPALTVAYMWRFWTRIFAGTPAASSHAIPPLLVWPVVAAALLTIAGGLWPAPATRLAEAAAGRALETAYHFDLRPTNVAAIAAFAAGALALLMRGAVARLTSGLAGAHDLPERTYYAGIRLARRAGAAARGRQPRQLRARFALVLAAAALLVGAGQATAWPAGLTLRWSWSDAPFAAILLVTIGLALLTATRRRHLTMVMMLSVTSLATGGLFAAAGAPDVALVLVIINVVATLLLLALLHRFPRHAIEQRERAPRRRRRGADELLAGIAGGLVFLVAWGTFSQPRPATWLGEILMPLAAAAHARNVVTAILVDFRGLDTLGEITVVVISVVALERLLKHREEQREEG